MMRVDKHLRVVLLPLAVLLPALVVVLLFAKPAVPKRVELFAGPQGSAYLAFAQRYADYLVERGVEVQIVETSGSLENLRLLAAGDKPAAAFALSGVEGEVRGAADPRELESLGSLSYQPFWLFASAGAEVTTLGDLTDRRVALGPADSDVRAIAKLLLADSGLEDEIAAPSRLQESLEDMAEALVEGRLDAAFMLGQPDSPPISELLSSAAVEPCSIQRLDAYLRLHPWFGKVVVPAGLYDMARNIPTSDLRLLSAADNLVVRSDLHPVVVDLLLDAAKSIHREPTLFADRGTFPNMRHASLPLSEAAVRFYEEGPPAWRKYLPYWLATLISRFALITAQVGAVVLIILKGLPALLRTRFKMRVLGFYRRMELVEKELEASSNWSQSVSALREIEDEVSAMKVPRFMVPDHLELRQNLHDLRERMEVWHGDHPEISPASSESP